MELPQDLSRLGCELINKIISKHQTVVTEKGTVKAPVDDVSAIERADQNLLAAISRTPDDPALYNQLGLLYASSAEYDKAVSNLQKSIDCAHIKLAQLADAEKQLDSKGETEKVAKLLLERSRLNVELSAAHSTLARAYDQLGQHDRVVGQLEQLNTDVAFGSALTAKVATTGETGSNSSHKLSREVLGLLARAEALFQARRTAEAMEQYRQVLKIDPLAASAHRRLGELAMSSNNSYLGLHELEIAAHLEPHDTGIHNALGCAYRSEGQPDKAIEQFEKALALDANSLEAATNLGNLFCATGQLKPAQRIFLQISKLNPDSSVAHNNLGTLMSMNDDYTGAIDEFEQALRLSPDLVSAHYGLGCAFYNTNNYASSIREFKRALALNPSLTDAQTKLQLAYRKSGDVTTHGIAIN